MKEELVRLVARKKNELEACKMMSDYYLDESDFLKCHTNQLHISILKRDIDELKKILRFN